MWKILKNRIHLGNNFLDIIAVTLLVFSISPREQRMAEAKGTFYLQEDDSRGVKPHYFGVESETDIPIKQQMGDSSVEDEGQLVTVDGQIRIHHRVGFVNLARRPDELESFRTSSRWTTIERIEGSDSEWKIEADEDSVLELFVNLDNPLEKQYRPLYLAPGFEGKIYLAKGEWALVFGMKYAADRPQQLVITWDGVKVVTKRTNILVLYCIVVGILALSIGGFLALLIQRKKRQSSNVT